MMIGYSQEFCRSGVIRLTKYRKRNHYQKQRNSFHAKTLLLALVLLLPMIVQAAICDGEGQCNPCKTFHPDNSDQTKCIECEDGFYLTFLSDDRVLCGQAQQASQGCKLDPFYTTTQLSPIPDPGNLDLYTLKDGSKVCYACNLEGNAFNNCKKCGDETFDFENELDAEKHALKSSVGCAVCEDSFFPQIEPHSVFNSTQGSTLLRRDCIYREDTTTKHGELCSWSKVWKTNLREPLNSNYGQLECVDCADAIPGCFWCSSGSECLTCQSDAFTVTSLSSTNQKNSCFHNFCGLDQKGVSKLGGAEPTCETCSIPNCKECAFDFIKFGDTEERCLLCDNTHVLSADSKTCKEQKGVDSMDLFVLPTFNEFKVSDEKINSQARSSSLGESLSEPLAFIQQALNLLATDKHDEKLGTLKQADVTIHLGKGDHFFFACFGEQIDVDISVIKNSVGDVVTDFCGQIDTLRAVYAQSNNIRLTVKPINCALRSQIDEADLDVFNEFCVDLSISEPQKPRVLVNSAFVNFNITNEATFEDIEFEGNDNIAFYLEGINKGKAVIEFPVQVCSQTVKDDTHHGYDVVAASVPVFSRQCIRPKDLSQGFDQSYPRSEYRCSERLSDHVKPLCSGEPYSDGFYETHEGFFARRRRVLFNLYAFDDFHSSLSRGQNVPTLTLRRCKFSKFMSGQHEALIQVESNNLYPVVDSIDAAKGFIKHLGADNGARITISQSAFEYSRFCKGLIVYREGVDYQAQNPGVLSFQKESTGNQRDETCQNCRIQIVDSSFEHLNYGTNIRALRQLQDYRPDVLNSTLLDTSGLKAGAISAPQFQNFGSVLNIQDFKGAIEVFGSTFNKNMINIPDIFEHAERHASTAIEIDHQNLQYYLQESLKVYELAKCETDQGGIPVDRYLFRDGIDPYLRSQVGLASLFSEFERHSGVAYISRPVKPVIFYKNAFSENIGIFGGAVAINSPNFDFKDDRSSNSASSATVPASNRPYLLFAENKFSRNMAYLSGNAIFVQGTKRSDRPLDSCSTSFFSEQDTFENNFGFKVSDGGAISLSCIELADQLAEDFGKSSTVPFDFSKNDEEIKDEIFLSVSSRPFKPLYRTAYIKGSKFNDNRAGRQGSALYVKGLNNLLVSQSVFKGNRAVDVLQEISQYPAYSKYLLESSTGSTSANFRPFSLMVEAGDRVECGVTELDYLARCANAATKIPQSVLQGAIYLEGGGTMHCDATNCSQERMEIQNTEFEANEITFNYQWVSDFSVQAVDGQITKQASAIFVKNVRDAWISNSKFFNHKKSSAILDQLIQQNMITMSGQFPEEYFRYSQASMIRIEQRDTTGLSKQYRTTLTQNAIHDNYNFQQLGFGSQSYYSGALINAEAEDPGADILLAIRSNDFYWNKAIGPMTSLVFIKDYKYVEIKGNSIEYSGHVSDRRFSPPTLDFTPQERASSSETVNLLFAQEFGQFYFDLVNEVQVQGNSFRWCGAVWGTAFYNYNSAFRAQLNAYSYMVAINGGAIMRQEGQGIRSAIDQDSVVGTIGVAYSLEGGSSYDEQVSMYYFKKISLKDCVGEDAGYLKLVRSGAIQCNQCNFYMQERLSRETILLEFINGPTSKESVFSEAYMKTRIPDGINPLGPIVVISSQYTGGSYNFTLGDESFQASPRTRPDMLWFKYCKFWNLRGGLSGVFYVDHSHVYLSNPDGIFGRRVLSGEDQDFEIDYDLVEDGHDYDFDEHLHEDYRDSQSRRRLGRSGFVSRDNIGSKGAGFFYAIDNSLVAFKGQNLIRNRGIEGGVIALRDSSLNMDNTASVGHGATNYGGFISAINSVFNIEISVIEEGSSGHGCAVFSQGAFQGDSEVAFNRIFRTNIRNHNCEDSIIKVVMNELEMESVKMLDNLHSGQGTNGIIAVSSSLTFFKLEVIQSQGINKKLISARVGVITLLEDSKLILRQSSIQRSNGIEAGAIFSRGNTKITLTDVNFQSSVTQIASGALIDVVGAEFVNIERCDFYQNVGAPVLRLVNTFVTIKVSDFQQTIDARFIEAINTNMEIEGSDFFKGGDFDQLGGAIYWTGNSLTIQKTVFQENRAASGGALYLIGQSPGLINIAGNNLLTNRAQQGGAIAIITADAMLIQNNRFAFNSARAIYPITVTALWLPSHRAQGGAIYSLCAQPYGQRCDVTLLKNRFENNQADDEGGATIWLNKPFIIEGQPISDENPDLAEQEEFDIDTNDGPVSDNQNRTVPETEQIGELIIGEGGNVYVDNNSTQQDDAGQANIPVLLVFDPISNHDPSINSTEAKRDALKFDQFAVVSGVPIEFQVLITDDNGELYVTEDKAVAEIKVLTIPGPGRTVTLIGNKSFSSKGIIHFSDLVIISDPGFSFELEMSIDLQNEVDGSSLFATKQTITVSVRECVDGEQFTEEGTCRTCPAGTYLLDRTEASRSCKACEPNAVCFGGNKLAPKDGYWRSDVKSTTFIQCLNPDACLEGSEQNPMGICRDQYEGPLCSQCSGNYYSEGASHVCSNCYVEDMRVRFISISIFMLLVVGLVINFVVFSNSLVEIRPQNYIPATLKLLSAYLQLVFVFARIQTNSLKGRDVANSVIYFQTMLVQEFRQINRCWLADYDRNWVEWERTIWMTSPLTLFAVGATILVMILLMVRRFETFPAMSYQLFYTTFFFLHVEVAFQIITSFDCPVFMGEKVFAEDLTRSCFAENSSHRNFLLTRCVPSGIVWLVLVPILSMVFKWLKRYQIKALMECNWTITGLTQKEQKEVQQAQFLFGFHLNGLRRGTHLWDTVIIARNFGIIVLYSSMHAASYPHISIILALTCFLIPFLMLSAAFRPYKCHKLNQLEIGTTIVLLLVLLDEMAETIRIDHMSSHGEKVEESVSLALLFVTLPAIIYMFMLIRFLREQMLNQAFYYSHRLFKILSCGTKSIAHYAHHQVQDYEEAVKKQCLRQLQREDNEHSHDIVNPKHVRLNFKRIETHISQGRTGKISRRSAKKVSKTYDKPKRHDAIQLTQSDSFHENVEENLGSSDKNNISQQAETQVAYNAYVDTEHDLLSDQFTGRKLIEPQYTGENVLNENHGKLLRDNPVNSQQDAKGQMKRHPQISIKEPSSSIEQIGFDHRRQSRQPKRPSDNDSDFFYPKDQNQQDNRQTAMDERRRTVDQSENIDISVSQLGESRNRKQNQQSTALAATRKPNRPVAGMIQKRKSTPVIDLTSGSVALGNIVASPRLGGNGAVGSIRRKTAYEFNLQKQREDLLIQTSPEQVARVNSGVAQLNEKVEQTEIRQEESSLSSNDQTQNQVTINDNHIQRSPEDLVDIDNLLLENPPINVRHESIAVKQPSSLAVQDPFKVDSRFTVSRAFNQTNFANRAMVSRQSSMAGPTIQEEVLIGNRGGKGKKENDSSSSRPESEADLPRANSDANQMNPFSQRRFTLKPTNNLFDSEAQQDEEEPSFLSAASVAQPVGQIRETVGEHIVTTQSKDHEKK